VKRILIIGGALVLVAIIVIASVSSSGPKGEKVYVEPVTPKSIQAVVTAPGEIDPKLKVNISAHIVGKIERIYFKEGDPVKRGQKLVDLEKFAYQAQYDRARAEVANRRIEVARARTAVATSETAYRRAMNLEKQGISAQEAFDRARQEYQNAQAAYSSSGEGLRQAEATLLQTRTDLDRTTIVSPIDGKAVQLNAHEGEVVVTGTMNNAASVIAVIADLSEILVEAEVGETEVTAVDLGQKATVKVDAVPDKEYQGHVAEIGSSAAVRQSGSGGLRYFKVKVAIDDPDAKLRPGMTSQVAIVTTSAPQALSVPIQSVVERVPPSDKKSSANDEEDDSTPKRKYVFLVKDGKAAMTEVRTGISDTTHVAIVSGIKSGDQIVTGPFRTLKKLKNGEKVLVTKEEKKQTSEKA
jgi:HlyD family secretion protein